MTNLSPSVCDSSYFSLTYDGALNLPPEKFRQTDGPHFWIKTAKHPHEFTSITTNTTYSFIPITKDKQIAWKETYAQKRAPSPEKNGVWYKTSVCARAALFIIQVYKQFGFFEGEGKCRRKSIKSNIKTFIDSHVEAKASHKSRSNKGKK